MANCEYKFEGSKLEEWLIQYFEKNGNIKGDYEKVNLFIMEYFMEPVLKGFGESLKEK